MALTDSLQAFYSFNSDWTDSINSNDATPTGAIIDTSVKLVGAGSAKIDGIDDRARVTNHATIDITGDLSISFWLYMNSWTFFPSILMKARTGVDEGGNKVQYGFYINSSGVAGKLRGLLGNGSANAQPQTDSNLTLATWCHVVLVRGGSTVTRHIDTVAQAVTGTLSGNLHTNSFDMDIGHDIRYPGSQRVVGANIDALGIWDKALTAGEISELYNGGAGIELPLVIDATVNANLLSSGYNILSPTVTTGKRNPTVPVNVRSESIPSRVKVDNTPTISKINHIPKRGRK